MSHEYPPLALDDLVHLVSPSPAQSDNDQDVHPSTKSASPEPLPESDIAQMHKKAVEMRHTDNPDAQLTPREMELAEMVLRLTALVRPDPDQLLRQAETISALTRQRDLLLYQAEEQRLRWNSEKDGWARMAEALLAQQARIRLNNEQDEDSDRLHAAEADNKGLRQRLNETQSRLLMLESELTRLRPLLLMQPLISRTSMPPPTPNPKFRRRKRDAATTEDEHGPSEDDVPLDPFDTPSQASHSQATPRAKSRKSEANTLQTSPHKRRSSQKAASRSFSADARAEHLLLAARRIGKHRAGIASGLVHYVEEQERERRREESAATAVGTTPKTPKRNTSYAGYPSEAGYVYVNGQMRPAPVTQPVPMFIPTYPHHLLQTPSSSTTAPSVTSSAQPSAQKPKRNARTYNPPTPLDSLLNAARSMMHEDIDAEIDEDEEVDVVVGDSATKTSARHPRPRDMLGSPVSKRRKVLKVLAHTDKPTDAVRATDNTSSVTNSGAGRVRSALDVLADQAAAFSSQEQPQAKGKERADTPPDEPSHSTPKPRARTRSKRKEHDGDTVSSTPTSRPSTPRTDPGENPTDSMRVTHLVSRGSEVQVDPGGECSTDPSQESSTQTLDSNGNRVTDNDTSSPRLPDMSLDAEDATPRQGSCIRANAGEGSSAMTTQQVLALPVSLPESEQHEPSPSPLPEPPPTSNETTQSQSSAPKSTPAKNKGLIRVIEQDPSAPVKRQRSPYVKWSKEEDDLLAQAVAKYGQKWDLVQKALPSRGYHQVRQRWLRKLGVFDSKPDLSSLQTAASGDGVEQRGPKLGLAPLSSERAFSVVPAPRLPL